MSTASGCDDCDDCDDKLIMEVNFVWERVERGIHIVCYFGES